jgi:hypothetical protein
VNRTQVCLSKAMKNLHPICLLRFGSSVSALSLCSRSFVWLNKPWRCRRHVTRKRRLSFNGLHGVISQKIELFITTSERTWNPTRNYIFPLFSASFRLSPTLGGNAWFSFGSQRPKAAAPHSSMHSDQRRRKRPSLKITAGCRWWPIRSYQFEKNLIFKTTQ